MISISKPKVIAIVLVTLALYLPLVSSVNALYTFSLPSNVLYADDFETYPTSGTLDACLTGCSGATGTANGGGWSYYDSDTGGVRNITTHVYYSGSHSLLLTSANTVGGKYDVHREFGTSNTTQLVTLSVWTVFDNKTRNRNNQLTYSIEDFDYVNKYECVLVIYPNSAFVAVSSPDNGAMPGGGLVPLRISAYDDTRMTYTKAVWHHITMTCDILNDKYISASIDNWDIGKALAFSSFPGGPRAQSLADAELLVSAKPFTLPVRVEFADVNDGGTFTNPTDIYHKYVDDLIITDTTTGVTCGLICLSTFNGIFAMMAMLPLVVMGGFTGWMKRLQMKGIIGSDQAFKALLVAIVIIVVAEAVVFAIGKFLGAF